MHADGEHVHDNKNNKKNRYLAHLHDPVGETTAPRPFSWGAAAAPQRPLPPPRGGIRMPIGTSPEIMSQHILAGRLAVHFASN